MNTRALSQVGHQIFTQWIYFFMSLSEYLSKFIFLCNARGLANKPTQAYLSKFISFMSLSEYWVF